MKQLIKDRIEYIKGGRIPEGYKKTEFGVFPVDWNVISLNDASVGKGKYGLNEPACEFDKSLPRYIRITDIDESGKFIDNKVSVNTTEIDEYRVSAGDILFARTGASVGKTYLYDKSDGDLVYAGFLIKFSINQNEFIPYYVFANCKIISYDSWVKKISARSGQPGINAEEFATYKFVGTKIKKEQQKIAEILMVQDKVIELKSKVIKEKQNQKKYLMQQLLSGKIRLKGFDRARDNIKIGAICSVFSGGTPRTSEKGYYCGDIPFIRSAEIDKNKTELFISDLGFKNSSAKMVAKGDLLYALYGANSGECAISKQMGAINQAILCIRTDNNNQYLYYFLLNDKDNIVNTYIQGGQGNLSAEIVKNIYINLPSLPEQNAIAEILSTADREIELLEKGLENEKQRKNALMQLLLTGVVRVSV